METKDAAPKRRRTGTANDKKRKEKAYTFYMLATAPLMLRNPQDGMVFMEYADDYVTSFVAALKNYPTLLAAYDRIGTGGDVFGFVFINLTLFVTIMANHNERFAPAAAAANMVRQFMKNPEKAALVMQQLAYQGMAETMTPPTETQEVPA